MTHRPSRLLRSAQSQDVFAALFAVSPLILHAVDERGRFLGVSDTLAEKLGYSVEEMQGQPMVDFLTKEARLNAGNTSIPTFHRQDRSKAIKYDFARKDGGVYPVMMTAFAQNAPNGTPLQSFVVGFDASNTGDAEDDMHLQEKMILIVEDDALVRTVLARQLKDQKLRVFEAETGDHAFKAMASGLQPDLLLTDVVMPGALQGPDLAQKARGILPDLQVLFMSGYPMDMSDYADEIDPKDPQLVKPVTQDKLVSAIQDLLTHA